MTLLMVIGLIFALCLIGTIVGSIVVVSRISALVTVLQNTVDDLQAQVDGFVNAASELVEDVSSDVDKFEHLLDSANSVTESLGSASRLAYSAVATPIVRAKALRAGMGKLTGVFKVESVPKKGPRK